MTCPHANISLPTTSDPDTICADCGEILQGQLTMKNTNPYRTIFHRDGSVTVWNCLTSNWHRTSNPSDDLLATLSEPERSRVIRHCGL